MLETWVLQSSATLSLNLGATLINSAPWGNPVDLSKPQIPLWLNGDNNTLAPGGCWKDYSLYM